MQGLRLRSRNCLLHAGSAENGSDYTAVSSSLTFPATTSSDDAMQCINVSITDDSVFEDPETFTVTVTTTTPRVTVGNDNTTVTITDNESQYVLTTLQVYVPHIDIYMEEALLDVP